MLAEASQWKAAIATVDAQEYEEPPAAAAVPARKAANSRSSASYRPNIYLRGPPHSTTPIPPPFSAAPPSTRRDQSYEPMDEDNESENEQDGDGYDDIAWTTSHRGRMIKGSR